MVCGPNHRVDARAIGQTWIFEQTELELEREQARHGVVQQTLVEQTFAYRRDGTPHRSPGVVMIKSLPALTASAAATV